MPEWLENGCLRRLDTGILRLDGDRRLSPDANVQHFGRDAIIFLSVSNFCSLAPIMRVWSTKRKYLAFDIETAKTTEDGTDWRSCRPLGISCAATLLADSDELRLWHGGEDRYTSGRPNEPAGC